MPSHSWSQDSGDTPSAVIFLSVAVVKGTVDPHFMLLHVPATRIPEGEDGHPGHGEGGVGLHQGEEVSEERLPKCETFEVCVCISVGVESVRFFVRSNPQNAPEPRSWRALFVRGFALRVGSDPLCFPLPAWNVFLPCPLSSG